MISKFLSCLTFLAFSSFSVAGDYDVKAALALASFSKSPTSKKSQCACSLGDECCCKGSCRCSPKADRIKKPKKEVRDSKIAQCFGGNCRPIYYPSYSYPNYFPSYYYPQYHYYPTYSYPTYQYQNYYRYNYTPNYYQPSYSPSCAGGSCGRG